MISFFAAPLLPAKPPKFDELHLEDNNFCFNLYSFHKQKIEAVTDYVPFRCTLYRVPTKPPKFDYLHLEDSNCCFTLYSLHKQKIEAVDKAVHHDGEKGLERAEKLRARDWGKTLASHAVWARESPDSRIPLTREKRKKEKKYCFAVHRT